MTLPLLSPSLLFLVASLRPPCHPPRQSLKALDGCEKTLNAVLKRYGREVWLKRSARNRGVPGGSLVVDDKSIVGVERGLEINEASAPAQKKQKVAAAADGPVAVKAEVF